MATRRSETGGGSRRPGERRVGGDRRRPAPASSSNIGVILLVACVVVAAITAVVLMGGDDKKKADTTPIETMDTPVETGDGTAGRTNAGTASTAKLKPLYTGDVSRAPWVKIETLMSEAYHLERMAKAIRAKDGDEAFRREIKKALKEFREAQLLFYDWQDEVEALAEGLFDRRFKREDTKFTRLNKTMRKYFQFEK